ncbi:hypothetical protein QJS04_geneDACA005881 [Acorus gramineus]|uniref:Uncharacterized protein n=1 Tax=Acorus gramineus TaxID=55184 RepID=A0AAV9B4U5_ACOGR|nr:hypothetical protein QJS04_geneDACA005881 [Acorus gramineus]
MVSSGALPLQIEDDQTNNKKFYSRLLSKESSIEKPSFRVYYGGASGAVPFMWESQPGTPKEPISAESRLPPLTPPPSFLSSPNPKRSGFMKRQHSKNSNLLRSIFPKLMNSPKKPPRFSSSPSVSSSSSASTSSSSWSTFSTMRRFSSFDEEEEEEAAAVESPRSPLCYGGLAIGGLRRCYSVVVVKNALLSVVGGHGSSQGSRNVA